MGASVNLKNAAGGFFYTLPMRANLYDKRLELEQQGGVVCMKANMCSTPLRRATLSLAGSALFSEECIDLSMQSNNKLLHSKNSKRSEAPINRSTPVWGGRSSPKEELERRFHGR